MRLEISSRVGGRLREVRRGKHFTQDDLAWLMGEHGYGTFTRETISEIERGRRKVSIDEFCGFAYVLEIRPVDLLPGLLRLTNT